MATSQEQPRSIGKAPAGIPQWYLTDWAHGTFVPPLLLGAAVLLAIAAVIFLIRATKRIGALEIVATPSAETVIQRSGEVREVPDSAVAAWASFAATTLDSFTYENQAGHLERCAPFIHPRFKAAFEAEWHEQIQKLRGTALSRSLTVHSTTITRSKGGRMACQVAYSQFDLTGKREAERALPLITQRVVDLDLVLDVPTDENPLGLFIIGRTKHTLEEWKAAGRPDPWAPAIKPTKK